MKEDLDRQVPATQEAGACSIHSAHFRFLNGSVDAVALIGLQKPLVSVADIGGVGADVQRIDVVDAGSRSPQTAAVRIEFDNRNIEVLTRRAPLEDPIGSHTHLNEAGRTAGTCTWPTGRIFTTEAKVPKVGTGGSVCSVRVWEERESDSYCMPVGVCRDAGVSPNQGELPDGNPYAYDTFAINPNLVSAGSNFLTNGDRSAESSSAAITFTKRLSNRWMARGFVNYIFKEEWNVPSSYFDNNDPNRTGPNVIDGQPFNESGYVSSWQWNLNGMYQVAPERWWGFNVAANLTGRQGYPIRYIRQIRGSDGIFRGIMIVEDLTDFRKDDVFVTDLRIEKEFAASGSTSLTVSIDGFNMFNKGYVLGRNSILSSPSAQWVTETLSPRIYRLGVRVNWR